MLLLLCMYLNRKCIRYRKFVAFMRTLLSLIITLIAPGFLLMTSCICAGCVQRRKAGSVLGGAAGTEQVQDTADHSCKDVVKY